MTNPPDGLYHKPYDEKPVKTADGVLIQNGLRVFTNNLDVGTINLVGAQYEWHAGERRYVLWFDVNCDTDYKGNACDKRELQSDDRVATRNPFNGLRAENVRAVVA